MQRDPTWRVELELNEAELKALSDYLEKESSSSKTASSEQA